MPRNEQYDWLDDPFDEKKEKEELKRAQAGGGMRAAGCALVLVACVVFIVATLAMGVAALGSLR